MLSYKSNFWKMSSSTVTYVSSCSTLLSINLTRLLWLQIWAKKQFVKFYYRKESQLHCKSLSVLVMLLNNALRSFRYGVSHLPLFRLAATRFRSLFRIRTHSSSIQPKTAIRNNSSSRFVKLIYLNSFVKVLRLMKSWSFSTTELTYLGNSSTRWARIFALSILAVYYP